MMPAQYNLQNKVFFYTILAILGALAFWLVSGYLDVIAFSLMMVIILKPVYDYFHKRVKLKPGLATTATLISLAVAVVIPGWFMLRIVTNQLTAMSESLTPAEEEQPAALTDFQERANELLSQVPAFHNVRVSDELVAEASSYARASVGWLGMALVNLGMAIPT